MNNKPKIAPLILAAGQGKRMQSTLPKVMHQICGIPMLEHVLRASLKVASCPGAVLINSSQNDIRKFLQENFKSFAICQQNNPRGTADAVASFAPLFENVKAPTYADAQLLTGNVTVADFVLILYGDVPGVRAETLQTFIDFTLKNNSDIAVIGMTAAQPKGYGRIVKKGSKFVKIVEERDCSELERQITLCNTGVFLAKTVILFDILNEISPNNLQHEYYLTDCIPIALRKHLKVDAFECPNAQEFLGVNDPEQLKNVEAIMRKNICAEL